jgi:hypothetical protein
VESAEAESEMGSVDAMSISRDAPAGSSTTEGFAVEERHVDCCDLEWWIRSAWILVAVGWMS